jgi:putative glutamine amidotransferase
MLQLLIIHRKKPAKDLFGESLTDRISPGIRMIFIALAFSIFNACTQPPAGETARPFFPGEKHLLLMHPTTNNINTITYLIDEGIFALPEGYHIVGVYSKSAAYDYSRSEAYIADNDLTTVSLFGTDSQLKPELIFDENELSEVFGWLFENSEGAIFMGGPDIPPAVYGHSTNLLTVITDPQRHYMELSFLFHLLGGKQVNEAIPLLKENPDYCILGICLGMQSLNVATGGTLYQDIPTELYDAATVEDVTALDDNVQHRNNFRVLATDNRISYYRFHQIMIEPGSILSTINAGNDYLPYVLSSHHQAIRDLGKGLEATAWSMDGKVVEAVEHTDYPNVFGIQFHPEPPYLYQEDHKLSFIPGEEPMYSFPELYPKERGENFHRSFWKYAGMMF